MRDPSTLFFSKILSTLFETEGTKGLKPTQRYLSILRLYIEYNTPYVFFSLSYHINTFKSNNLRIHCVRTDFRPSQLKMIKQVRKFYLKNGQQFYLKHIEPNSFEESQFCKKKWILKIVNLLYARTFHYICFEISKQGLNMRKQHKIVSSLPTFTGQNKSLLYMQKTIKSNKCFIFLPLLRLFWNAAWRWCLTSQENS